MTFRFFSVVAGAALALALAACGASQEPGQVPADSPILEYEAPESMPGDEGGGDDLFSDEDFEDLDELEEGEGSAAGEDEAEPEASKTTASGEGASAPAEGDAADGSAEAGRAE